MPGFVLPTPEIRKQQLTGKGITDGLQIDNKGKEDYNSLPCKRCIETARTEVSEAEEELLIMPQWNYKSEGAGRKKFGKALAEAKKKHPIKGSDHRNLSTKRKV